MVHGKEFREGSDLSCGMVWSTYVFGVLRSTTYVLGVDLVVMMVCLEGNRRCNVGT